MSSQTVNGSPAASPRGGTETILLAEDSPDLRKMSAQVLRSFGYVVIEAADGAEAVERFGSDGHGIALVILDRSMPRVSGLEAYREMKAVRPDLRCIFASGCSDELTTEGGEAIEADVVEKPFSPFELLATVREVLDR